MATTAQPARSCVLKVRIKCCKGCQTNAKRKLLSVSGVSAVEYNAELGLLTVSGDPNPATLLGKLAKWDKNAELVSFLGQVSSPAPITHQTKTMEKRRPTKCFLLWCFGNPRTNEKVEPYLIARDENGSPTPFVNTTVAPPMVYPPPQAIPGFTSPIPYPPPCFGSSQPPPPPPPYIYTSGMFHSAPPTFQLRKTQMVNSGLHYPRR